jgi:hypothetical protein
VEAGIVDSMTTKLDAQFVQETEFQCSIVQSEGAQRCPILWYDGAVQNPRTDSSKSGL